MKLSQEDIELFYKLHWNLLFYTNQKYKIIKDVSSPDDFGKQAPEKVVKVRNKLYEEANLIDSFVKENPFNLSKEELKIIESWKDFVKGTFYVFRYLKDHAVFLNSEDPPKAYGVLALKSDFEEMVGPYLPVAIETVLLPFKDKVTYDGLFNFYNIHFGGGFRRGLNEAYREAKYRFGIITNLTEAEEKEESDVDKLKFYLSTKSNKERYWNEAVELSMKSHELDIVFHQELGKADAKVYKKRLKGIGVTKAWFAVLDGTIVAAGETQEELKQILRKILPEEKQDFPYVFQLKG